jgi:mono/diheme cytochrome c family protein
MKERLLAALALVASPLLNAQLAPPTSVPVDMTKTSLLSKSVDRLGQHDPRTNFRFFLNYSAKTNFTVKFGDHPVELPAGENATAEFTFEHLPNSPALIHLSTSGDPTTKRIEIPGTLVTDGNTAFKPLPGKDFPMDEAFTLMVRFKTTTKKGTLAALAPAKGKWAPGGKTLFIQGGRLHYDVGWEGAIDGGKRINDGREHLATLVGDDKGGVRIFLDGKEVASSKELTSEDQKDHVFKVGTTSPDFGGDFKDGSIDQVLFWKRSLTAGEIATAAKKKVDELNTPDFHWKKPEASQGKLPDLVETGVHPGFGTTLSIGSSDGLTLHEAWIQPLETSNHREIVKAWNKDSLKRGREIYNQLCITCHGTEKQEGSIPIALKFHEGKFKNGNDPYRMYQTLTKGYGMMMPMPQFSTRQKYDVIHYIREEYLKKHNESQLSKIDESYLASLPRGMSQIEEKESKKTPPPYKQMDFGNVLFWTYQIEPGPLDTNVNIAQKGIAIRVDEGPGGISKGKAWAVYDHDTMRLAAIYTGDEFVDWKGIAFDGSHGTHTSIVGKRILVNDDKPGWAHPETGSFEPIRTKGKDGRLFGPLPKDWLKFRGLYNTTQYPTIEYTVGQTRVRESIQELESDQFFRCIEVGPSKTQLKLRLHPFEGDMTDAAFEVADGSLWFNVPPAKIKRHYGFKISLPNEKPFVKILLPKDDSLVFEKTKPTIVTTKIQRGDETGPFAVDTLTVPVANLNPHQSWMRTSGFDFYPDGKRAAVCTWMGDVWIVEGIDQLEGTLTWKRICSGLFQPLGLKIIDDKIHVTCRDQLAKLHDLNNDETIDYIECLNNDHQVTEHFHEFAMGLQTDDKGNFYYAKSARHAKDSLVPHHGTLLRVSADGSKTDILATGFRAANGVCLNPDGTFIVTDQEGHWNPKNRINWVNGDGPTEFFGNVYGYSPVTDTSDEAMKNPLCWITNAFDRSPSELLWVPKDARWGSLNGQLLNLSYGYGKIYVVPHETINSERQGGMCELPLKQFPTGIMRGRFHPGDGQLYGCGMFAWAGTQRKAGGFYRIRKTEKPANLPTKIEASKSGVTLTLSDEIDPASVKPESFRIKAWDLKRTKNYGSKHFNEREWKVTKATISGDQITLIIPDLKPTWGMSIEMKLTGSDGEKFTRLVHNSIFELPD